MIKVRVGSLNSTYNFIQASNEMLFCTIYTQFPGSKFRTCFISVWNTSHMLEKAYFFFLAHCNVFTSSSTYWKEAKLNKNLHLKFTKLTLSRNAVLVSIAISYVMGKVIKTHINGNETLGALFICEATYHVCRMLETEIIVSFRTYYLFQLKFVY